MKLNIEADSADLIPLKRTVIENHRARIKAKGFRPGKAPMGLVNQQYGNQVRDEVYSGAVEKSFGDIVKAYREIIRAFGLFIVYAPKEQRDYILKSIPLSREFVEEVVRLFEKDEIIMRDV